MPNRHLILTACIAALATALMAAGASAQAPAPVTPRTADGKPDLSGMWGGVTGLEEDTRIDAKVGGENAHFAGGQSFEPFRRCSPLQVDCSDFSNRALDQEFTGRMDPNLPVYKPQYWDKIQYLDMNTNSEDPLFACQPYGITRAPPPARIVQSGKDVVFLYISGGASTRPADYRVIPIDGRPHDPVRSLDVTFYGDSVGKWEGDTLVIDSVGFNDLTWLQRGGYFHSDKMHLVERLRREGDTLIYQITVEDPEVLLEPWVMTPIRVRLNKSPAAYLPEGEPCKDYDRENMSSQIRH